MERLNNDRERDDLPAFQPVLEPENATKLQTTPDALSGGLMSRLAVVPWAGVGGYHPGRRTMRPLPLIQGERRWLLPLLSSVSVGSMKRCEEYARAIGRPGDSYRFSAYLRRYQELGLVRRADRGRVRWFITDQGAEVLRSAHAGILEQWGILHSVLPEGEAKELVGKLIVLCGGSVG